MEEDLFRVSRINGGWIVRESRNSLGAGNGRTEYAVSWDVACDIMRKIAFPYPNPSDPRGPAD